MGKEITFLDWAKPAPVQVARFLLEGVEERPVDLSHTMILVPTRQAGRRLRETLALFCDEKDTAVLSPRVILPMELFGEGAENVEPAPPLVEIVTWLEIFKTLDPKQFVGLFPCPLPERDTSWAHHTALLLKQVRDALVEGGLLIRDVLEQHAEQLQEWERWNDLGKLEALYLERIEEKGWQDLCWLKVRHALELNVPETITHVVLAALPDPTPVVVKYLDRISKNIDVTVLVHAPGSCRELFDDWGRPRVESWDNEIIEIPDDDGNLFLAATPEAQGRKVVDWLRQEKETYGPGDCVVGVPDQGVVPFIATALEETGLPVFDPSGKPVSHHPLFQLLTNGCDLVKRGYYEAVADYLRHPDVLQRFETNHSVPSDQILGQLDHFQNRHLPDSLESMRDAFLNPASGAGQRFPELHVVIELVYEDVQSMKRGSSTASIRTWLESVFEHRTLHPGRLEDDEFLDVATEIKHALDRCLELEKAGYSLPVEDWFDLLIEEVHNKRIYQDRAGALVDLEGWLELPWNDAPFVILTGMNEGMVPDGRVSDVFLPDTMRTTLGLRSDRDRLARDAYILKAILAARVEKGRVGVVVGKASLTGDPLKPSRLLFKCRDEDLPGRVERLFGEATNIRVNVPSTIGFPLKPFRSDFEAIQQPLTKMSVTTFGKYLACPFRYYLGQVLDMEEVGDERNEMDALDFGSLIHRAFQQMAENEEVWKAQDVSVVSDFLARDMEERIYKIYGNPPPVQVWVQLESAKQRMNHAAQVHRCTVDKGWELVDYERSFEQEIEGVLVKGKIDRIERNRDTGAYRILDYKTSEKAKKPIEDHLANWSQEYRDYARVTLGGREKAWRGLQIPLYRWLVSDHYDGVFEVGYFNLPKAVGETGIDLWKDFDQRHHDSAVECARGVIKDIKEGRFWPPASRVAFESLGRLFIGDPEDCFEPA